MLVAFAVGAFIASRSELFPPQVDAAADGVPEPSGSATPGPVSRWEGTLTSRTLQSYREGVCRTAWAGAVSFDVDGAGVVSGVGEAALGGKPDCPFPLRQPQVGRYGFTVEGRLADRQMRMRWSGFEPLDGGIVDHGGFGPTIADPGVGFDVRVVASHRGNERLHLRVQTAEGVKPARSRTEIELECVEVC
jgi:hypothetical protein